MYREEKRLDREMTRDVMFAMADAVRQQSEVSVQAIGLANRFVDSFKIDENDLRFEEKTVRNEDELVSAAKRLGYKQEDINLEELDPFRVIF